MESKKRQYCFYVSHIANLLYITWLTANTNNFEATKFSFSLYKLALMGLVRPSKDWKSIGFLHFISRRMQLSNWGKVDRKKGKNGHGKFILKRWHFPRFGLMAFHRHQTSLLSPRFKRFSAPPEAQVSVLPLNCFFALVFFASAPSIILKGGGHLMHV